MRTLVVNCYLSDAEVRMAHYRRLVAQYSAVVEVRSEELGPDFDLTGFDAVVFSGSQWMLTEKAPTEKLVAFVRRLPIPTLGICFGHQLLARSFGAEIRRAEQLIERDETIEVLEQWPLFDDMAGESSSQKSETRNQNSGRRSADSGRRLVVMRESHREFVAPESVQAMGWEIGARSRSCPVEAIRHPKLPLYGVQFHPERSGANGERLFDNFYRLIVG